MDSLERPSCRPWLAFHFFHHQDRDLLLRQCLLPLAAEACGSGAAERFFFVRYALGGPHVRLRLEPRPGTGTGELEALVAARAGDFFERFPSTSSRPAEKIAASSAKILAGDANETDATPRADNSFEAAEYRPETGRYGDGALLDASHDLFMASSLAAGELLAATAGLPPAQVFPRNLILLARLAMALAENDTELARLLGYGVRWFPDFAPLAARAAQRFAGGAATYLELWRRAGLPAGDSPILRHLAGRARALRQALAAGAPAPPIPYLLASHLHMTANRLGLDNTNEVLALALLARTHQEAGPAGQPPEASPDGDDRGAAVAAFARRLAAR